MEARELRRGSEQALEAHVLRGAELALKHKLRRKFSGDFMARHAKELIAQAAKEYVAARAAGKHIYNPGGFLVDTAYKRAIDALRKEERTPQMDELDAAASLPDPTATEPLEELEREEVRSQLYEAIAHLDLEERRVIALVYFEQMSGRETAGPLGVSESTALRRLRSASAKLREWLPAIEQGSFCTEAAPQLRALAEGRAEGLGCTQAKLHLQNCASCRETMARREAFGFEVGLVAWLSVTASQPSPGRLGEQLAAVLDGARHVFAAGLDRARDLSARLLGSGGAESASAVASGPMGKAAGACAATLAACALTGVIGPGVGGIDLGSGGHAAPPKANKVAASKPPATAPAPVARTPIAAPQPARNTVKPRHHSSKPASSAATASRAATAAATEQFGVESAAGPPEAESAPPPSEAGPPSSSSSSSSPSPTQIANEQFGP